MELSDVELDDLRIRCLTASQRGYQIARADEYLEALSSEASADVPVGEEEASAGHLYALACAALESRAGGAKKKSKKKEPEPEPEKKEAPKAPEKKEEAKSTIEVKDEPPPSDPGSESAPPYEEWTAEELYNEAKVREIPNRSKLNKDDLVLALYEHDEATAKASK